VAEQRFTHAYRHAYWKAFDQKCAYCADPIERMLYMEIDHVINEALANHADELSAVLILHGLPQEFDLYGALNLVCACKRCNSIKGPNREAGLVSIGLQKARKKAPVVEELLAAHKSAKKVDNQLSSIGDAIEGGITTKEYVREFLEIETANPLGQDPGQDDELLRVFGNASANLLNWPRTTRGVWIRRPELQSLQLQLEQPHSFTVLLGQPGSGKSALLGKLGEELSKNRVALLALKADLLAPEIDTLAALDESIGAQLPICDGLRELAETRTVVLLIDQLDALSELMVHKTSRLNLLLGLCNRLRGIENIHILLSCRSFEFEHDIRLASLKPLAITLDDPPFAAIEKMLQDSGVESAHWPAETKELLRRPQHLSFFLKHLSQDLTQVFKSYHAMMDSVLRARLARGSRQTDQRALEEIAALMAEEENPWLPASRFDDRYGNEIERLIAADVLTYSPDGARIGFRHQTLFDFVRARAFASGKVDVAQHVLERQDSLFVRPTLWSALHYLRNADRNAYRRCLQTLWVNQHLRRHIRLLITEFVGQVQNPETAEVALLLPALRDAEWGGHVVKSIRGNPLWFAQVTGDLPAMMAGDSVSAYHAAWLLRSALDFDGKAALSLIEQHWLPDKSRDLITIQTLGDLKAWDERAIRIAERAVRRSPDIDTWVEHLINVVHKSGPEFAPRIVAAELWGKLERASQPPAEVSVEAPPAESDVDRIVYQLVHGDAKYRAIKEIVTADTGHSRWHNIKDIARAAPNAFIEHVAPWAIRVASDHVKAERHAILRYRRDHIFDDINRLREDLKSGIEAGIAALAEKEPEAFLSFAAENQASDTLALHRWLAIGYAKLAGLRPRECAMYLLSDQRRLALGSYDDPCKETRALLIALAPHAASEDLILIEDAINNWSYYRDSSELDASARFKRSKWNREHRLELFRAIPEERRSPKTVRLVVEEGRALPTLPRHEPSFGIMAKIESPVKDEQMALASQQDLINLFNEMDDETARRSRRGPLRGTVIETSRAFGELAKKRPDRALSIFKELAPGRHEHYASEALRGLSESEYCAPVQIVNSVRELVTHGFQSETFRCSAAWSLAKAAEKLDGLDDGTCELLESWLQDWEPFELAKHTDQAETRKERDHTRSILWDRHGGILPHGNYPILYALFLGYMLRKPEQPNNWLRILQEHSRRREDPQVWIALAGHQLKYLGRADRSRASRLLSEVLSRPEITRSEDAARLIGLCHSWLPLSLTHSCLQQWQIGDWHDGPQAAAEVAMLRHGLVPDDAYCADIVNRIVEGRIDNPGHLSAMRLGLAYAAAEVWGLPNCRTEATRVLLALLPCARKELVQAWRIVFRDSWQIVDDCSRRILDAALQDREILRTPHGDDLVDRLKELLERNVEADRVCKIASALLDELGGAVGSFHTPWFGTAPDLINIALTLQQFPSTRSCAVEIFERLMAANAYTIDEVLEKLDRKWGR
jgi:hypothetical protein